MDKEIIIKDGRAFIGNIEYNINTGEPIIPANEKYLPSFAEITAPFSGVKEGKVIVNNETTTINADKFLALPKTIRERILAYPNSDYTRDVLSMPKGSIVKDTFPNFNNISYSPKGEAIILNDEKGDPIRAPFFPDI